MYYTIITHNNICSKKDWICSESYPHPGVLCCWGRPRVHWRLPLPLALLPAVSRSWKRRQQKPPSPHLCWADCFAAGLHFSSTFLRVGRSAANFHCPHRNRRRCANRVVARAQASPWRVAKGVPAAGTAFWVPRSVKYGRGVLGAEGYEY